MFHVADDVCTCAAVVVLLLGLHFIDALPNILRAWRGVQSLPPPATPSTSVPENTDG